MELPKNKKGPQKLNEKNYQKLLKLSETNSEPIKKRLKQIMNEEEYRLWIDPIKEITCIKSNKTFFDVPNEYYKDRIFKILEEYKIKEIEERKIQIFTPEKNSETTTNSFLKIQNSSSEVKLTMEIKPPPTANLAMEKPYSKENVATSEIISHKFFVFPNDKRKYGITNITLSDQEFIVHRGKKSPDATENPIGQLDTSHLKILLVIIHIWQEQGCNFFGMEALVELSITLREVAKKIGYKLKNGQNIKWLQQKVDELTKYPIALENKSNRNTTSFTFLKEFTTQRKDTKKTIVLTLNPILSKQLYERQSILRNQQCYKIKNPTALKFLIAYDKRIYACKLPFRLSLEEIAKELEMNGTKQDIKEAITKVIKNLNGYKLTETSEIKIIFDKENKENYIIIGKQEIIKGLQKFFP